MRSLLTTKARSSGGQVNGQTSTKLHVEESDLAWPVCQRKTDDMFVYRVPSGNAIGAPGAKRIWHFQQSYTNTYDLCILQVTNNMHWE